MSSNWLTPKGTGGQQANLKAQEDAIRQGMDLNQKQADLRKPFQQQYSAAMGQQDYVRGQLFNFLTNPNGSTKVTGGPFGRSTKLPNMFSKGFSTDLPSLPNMDDPNSIGRKVQDTYATLNGLNLNKANALNNANVSGNIARRGIASSTLARPMSYDQNAARMNGEGYLAGLNANQQDYINRMGQREEQQNSLMQLLSYLSNDTNRLGVASDITPNINAINQLAGGFGNVSNNYGQMADSNSNSMRNLANIAGYFLF